MTTNDASTHGYRWSDGTVHDTPEPKLNAALNVLARQPAREPVISEQHVTQEQYDRAFAAWSREFSAWRADMEQWRARNVKK